MNQRTRREGGVRVHGFLNDQDLLYLQIARMLEDDILRGIYREGEQTPSTNELARGYNINPATAAKGLNVLVMDGILYKRRGIGMFVASGAEERVRQKRKAAFYDGYVKPMVKEGTSLNLTGEELLSMVQQATKEELQ
jgi:DNA-binding transcriptional regulator YhcF (GntR family)